MYRKDAVGRIAVMRSLRLLINPALLKEQEEVTTTFRDPVLVLFDVFWCLQLGSQPLTFCQIYFQKKDRSVGQMHMLRILVSMKSLLIRRTLKRESMVTIITDLAFYLLVIKATNIWNVLLMGKLLQITAQYLPAYPVLYK